MLQAVEILEAAHTSSVTGGTDWVNELALAMRPLCRLSGELQGILSRHKMQGLTFSSTPKPLDIITEVQDLVSLIRFNGATVSERLTPAEPAQVIPAVDVSGHSQQTQVDAAPEA